MNRAGGPEDRPRGLRGFWRRKEPAAGFAPAWAEVRARCLSVSRHTGRENCGVRNAECGLKGSKLGSDLLPNPHSAFRTPQLEEGGAGGVEPLTSAFTGPR